MSEPPTTPRHIAIIMDGNGRWAQQRGLSRNEGHKQGVENVKRIVRAAGGLDIDYLTLFAFSVENWNRPRKEVKALMSLLESFLQNDIQTLHENNVRLNVLGRLDAMPKPIRTAISRVIKDTENNRRYTLNLALNYGSRTETLDAVKAYAEAVAAGRESTRDLDWDTFDRYLYTGGQPDPDLIIRTSGETRLSNFLLLQGAYAEFYFCPKLWPDFGPEDLAEAMQIYQQRERRFGKTGEQVRPPEPLLNR